VTVQPSGADVTPAYWWARRAVDLSVLALPHGKRRERYRRELCAELHGMAGPGQFLYSAGVLSRAWALRAALTDSTLLPKGNDTTPSVRLFWRLICRLNIHHDFVRILGEDSTPYESCARCGKDLYIPPGPGGGAVFGQGASF
jgi:hypothetical protein